MRKGLAMSIALHGFVLAWALGFFPGPETLRTPEVKAVPIDVVTISELTKIKAGLRDRKNAKTAPVVKKKTPPKPKKKAKVKPRKVKAARQKSAPKPKAQPRPKKTVKKAKPKPKPAKKVVDKAALDNLVSKALETKPTKSQRKKTTAKKNFNADRIAALLNKVPDAGDQTPSATEPKPDPKDQAKGRPSGFDQKLTISEIDALRARISQCWAPPTGATGADALKVRLRLNLNRDGTLTRQPQILNSGASQFFRVAADSAVRAVWKCQPYQLPAAKYDLWRDIVLNFDPREMFGG